MSLEQPNTNEGLDIPNTSGALRETRRQRTEQKLEAYAKLNEYEREICDLGTEIERIGALVRQYTHDLKMIVRLDDGSARKNNNVQPLLDLQECVTALQEMAGKLAETQAEYVVEKPVSDVEDVLDVDLGAPELDQTESVKPEDPSDLAEIHSIQKRIALLGAQIDTDASFSTLVPGSTGATDKPIVRRAYLDRLTHDTNDLVLMLDRLREMSDLVSKDVDMEGDGNRVFAM